MKKLQNNFTTPEQSKRLLELGVPADSADMFYMTDVSEIPTIKARAFGHIPSKELSIPCWSAARLMEINRMCNTASGQWNLYSNNDPRTLVEWMMDVFKNSQYDFSKLEED